jgi:hypothetical protein
MGAPAGERVWTAGSVIGAIARIVSMSPGCPYLTILQDIGRAIGLVPGSF